MSIVIKDVSISKTNHGGIRSLTGIKYIVVHYTGNDGDTCNGNINYYKSPNRGASANYFVDDTGVYRAVPDNTIAWHCGGTLWKDYKSTGGGKLYKVATNTNSIGIEICDVNRNGKYDISNKTRNNVLELVIRLMGLYRIDINHVIRHFDVTGKYCPRYWCPPYGSNDDGNKFKSDVQALYNTRYNKVNNVQVLDKLPAKITTSGDFKVRINVDCLNIRSCATTRSKITGQIRDRGVYTIVDKSVDGKWGKLKSGVGWIYLRYTTKL